MNAKDKLTLNLPTSAMQSELWSRLYAAQNIKNRTDVYVSLKSRTPATIGIARHRFTSKVVAVKRLNLTGLTGDASNSAKSVAKFLSRMLTKLPSTRGLAKLHEAFLDRGYFYIMTKAMEQGDLLHFMDHQKVPYFTEEEIHYGATHICEGLQSLHKAGFVHGDIRPSNIVVHKSKSGKL